MKKGRWFFFIAIFFAVPCFSLPEHVEAPPQLELKPSSDVFVEGGPLLFNLDITTSMGQKISSSQLHIDEPKALFEEIGRQVVNPENIYGPSLVGAPVVVHVRLTLPPKPAGIYTIGPVHCTLGAYTFDSNTSTINVQTPIISPSFRLEASILDKDTAIYPGQTVTFQYKLFFETPMKLTKEELPLLRPAGFLTKGSPEVTQEGGPNPPYIQVITQMAIARTPGVYDMGVSLVEGLRYITTPIGDEVLFPLYKAFAPSFQVQVRPFPEQGRPASFYGAIGSYAWRVRIPASDKVRIGEPFSVEYRASGRGDLSTVGFPPREVFGRLKNDFIVDSWPEEGKVQENTKTFLLLLRARRVGTLLIPGVAISSFDPASNVYLISEIPPLTVTSVGEKGETVPEVVGVLRAIGDETSLRPLEIAKSELFQRNWTGGNLVWTILFSFAVCCAQIFFRKRAFREKEEEISARVLFEKAVSATTSQRNKLSFFRKAMMLALHEARLIPQKTERVEELSEATTPLVKEVCELVFRIDQALYQGYVVSQEEAQEISEEALLLYHRIREAAR